MTRPVDGKLHPICALLRRKPGLTAMQICEEMDETYNHVLYRLKQLEEGLFIKKNINEPERKRWDKWYAV